VKVPATTTKKTQRETILDYLSTQEFYVSCWKMSKDTGIDNKTCSNICNKLYKDTILDKPFTGHYQIRPEYREVKEGENKGTGVSFTFWDCADMGLPRLQNVSLEADVCVVDVLPDYEFVGDQFSVTVRFGVTHDRVTVSIGCDLGLDAVSLCMVKRVVDDACSDYGFCDLDWWFTSYELFNDLYGVFMSGTKIIRWRDMYGNFVKLYEKPYGVRREVRSAENLQWGSMMSLLYGNPREFNYRREMDALRVEIGNVNATLRNHSHDIRQFSAFTRNIIEAFKEGGK